ncbi:MAG: ferredoxin--NADP reductase [Planctomycetaceae bacterium]
MTHDHPEYNATVTEIRFAHSDLMVMRVEPDDGAICFEPGQYTTLGLFTDERRLDQVDPFDDSRHQLIRRAYSISCPILDDHCHLVPLEGSRFLEFYIALVRKDSDFPPSLTPRIFAMKTGHRIYVGRQAKGTYTLAPVAPDRDVLFFATGTGEAPHNAMIRQLLGSRHQGRIASFVCVRHLRDLAYLSTHRELEKQFPNFRYVTLTTRESENIDRDHPGYVGKQYLQELFQGDRLRQLLGWIPDAATSHAFLCGNPQMIGAPRRDPDGEHSFPDPKGMIETLVEQGYRLDRPHDPGNIHFEKYW